MQEGRPHEGSPPFNWDAEAPKSIPPYLLQEKLIQSVRVFCMGKSQASVVYPRDVFRSIIVLQFAHTREGHGFILLKVNFFNFKMRRYGFYFEN
jgi:hypothetical protein